MSEQFERQIRLMGEDSLRILSGKHVAVFGIGGVGGHSAEALARAGIGHLTLVDNDKVALSNINRQIVALHSTVGRYKTEIMQERIRDINPEAEVTVQNVFFLPETASAFDLRDYDYVVDAIDTVTAKIELAVRCKETGTPVISCMGAGNKLDPARFEVADIYSTSVCPLAKVMRRELRSRGIDHLKVVYSKEEPERMNPPGSVSFVPSVAGLIMAGEVVRDLIRQACPC